MLITIPFNPQSYEPLVKEGQEVDFQTPLFKKKLEEEVILPLASKIKISPKNIYLHLRKVIGDQIEKGELLAEKKTFLSQTEYRSEYNGVIKEIDHKEGYLLIGVISDKEQTVTSYFKGEVTEVKEKELHIKLKSGQEFALSEASANFGGEVIVLDEAQIIAINEKTAGLKIVIAKKLASYDLSKLEALGIDGFVTVDSAVGDRSIPYAKLSKAEDFEKISKLKFQYCIIDKKKSIIYFYS